MVSPMPSEREHFLPVRRVDLERLLLDDAGTAKEERQALQEFAAILTATIHDDFHQRQERLKDLYDPINPDRDTVVVRPVAADEKALLAELESLLTRANYRRLPAEELNQALNEESVFQVRLHTRLDDFAELIIFHRGRRNRNEVLRGWFGRQRLLSVDYYSRVAIYARFQEAPWFAAKKRLKTTFKPGTALLKLFQDVPCADIEMLLPNAEVRMRPKDHLLLAVPAALGGIGVVLKFAATLAMVWFVLLAWFGLSERPRNTAEETAALVGFGLALVAIGGFAWRQLNNVKNRKLRFMKELADSLYYKSLDNNAGVFNRVLDEAEEEDAKEALLAYFFLHRTSQPVSEAELDTRIETWFRDTVKIEVDFEIDDALEKLARFKLAIKEGERWRAVPLTEAKRVLDERWDNKFTFA